MKLTIALAALVVSTAAQAEFLDGNDLLAKINSSSIGENMLGLGYVIGAADTMRNWGYCPPAVSSITAGQLRDVVRNYLEANPQTRHYTADVIVMVALGRAWPCAKTNTTPTPGTSL